MEQTIGEKLAAKMGIHSPEGVRIFTEGRSGKGVSHTEEVHNLRSEYANNLAEIQHIRDGRPAARREMPVRLTEAERLEERKERDRIAERTARAMRIETPEGRRVFREGRSAFNPGYNAADVRVRVVEAEGNV
jgi:hypothetical protein